MSAGARAPGVADLAPMPWTWITTSPDEGFEGSGHIYLVDANGRKIACIWGKAREKVAAANFICDATERGARAPAPLPEHPVARHP